MKRTPKPTGVRGRMVRRTVLDRSITVIKVAKLAVMPAPVRAGKAATRLRRYAQDRDLGSPGRARSIGRWLQPDLDVFANCLAVKAGLNRAAFPEGHLV